MAIVHLDELEAEPRETLGRVRDRREVLDIIDRAGPIARIVPPPVETVSREELERIWARRRRLAEEISAQWPDGVSAVEAIREQRRDP